MKKDYVIKAMTHTAKTRIVEGLIDSGYIVSSEFKKTKSYGSDPEDHWQITIYK